MTRAHVLNSAKAFTGAAVAAGLTAAQANSDGEWTRNDILTVLGAALIGGLAVWATPNKTKKDGGM